MSIGASGFRLLSIAIVLAVSACTVVREATVYPVDSKTPTEGTLTAKMVGHGTGHGTIEMTADGENFKGDYSIVFGGSVGFGNIFASAMGTQGAVTANGLATSVSIPNEGQGVALLIGDQGTTIQCEFLNNNMFGHGYGGCRSSKGAIYRFIY